MAMALEVQVQAKSYLDKDLNPYLELHIRIPSAGLSFDKNENGKWQAAAKLEIVVAQKGVSVMHETYPLISPELDQANLHFDLIDLKRVRLAQGPVSVWVWAMDYLSGQRDSQSVELLFQPPYLHSDLSLLHSYHVLKKATENAHGQVFIVPRLVADYGPQDDTLLLYFETYRKPGEYQILVMDMLGKLHYTQVLNHENDGFKQHIVRLPKLKIGSGQLELVLANALGEPLASMQVMVAKPDDRDLFMSLTTWELKRHFKSLEPFAGAVVLGRFQELIQNGDSLEVKEGFMNFWIEENRDFPWQAWQLYLGSVDYVNQTFATPDKPGYATDRGRVFLKYGPPIDIIEMHDNPQTYPFEIWQYGQDGKMGDSKFYFVNYTFGPNNFSLAHSTALGEVQNPNWRKTIDRGNQREGHQRDIGSGWENEYIDD
jgi:GWxTD domain-containing protein